MPNNNSTLGSNLPFLAPWSTDYTFIDAFKQSGAWLTQAFGIWDTREQHKLNLDEHGWVKSLPLAGDTSATYRWVGTVLFNALDGHYPGGQYVVYYEGEGTIEYQFDATYNAALSVPGRHVIDVQPGRTHLGILIKITATDPNGTGNHIRNIRVISPGFTLADAETQIFHPDFIDNIKRYRVLRFMDWMRTNWDSNGPIMHRAGSFMLTPPDPLRDAERNPYLTRYELVEGQRAPTDTLLNWRDRSKGTDARYTDLRGVPLEVMVALANQMGIDPWFNIPHLASDEYVAAFAAQVRNTLAGGRYVYIEYSNEIWNYGFAQGNWIEAQGQAEWPHPDIAPLHKRLSWFGKRTAEICTIFEAVFGPQSDRVVCVLATQSTNSWLGEQMLECPLWNQKPCYAHHIDAVAIAPYFGQHIGSPQYAALVNAWTTEPDGGLNKLFDELDDGSVLPAIPYLYKTPLNKAQENMSIYFTVANQRGLSLVAYEGGQHLVGFGCNCMSEAVNALFMNANNDPRMAAMYTQYFAHWHAVGGQFFNHYVNLGRYSAWGSWGAQEFSDSDNAPKRGAIDTYIAGANCTWATCTPPTAPLAVTLSRQVPGTRAGLPPNALLMVFTLLTLVMWAIRRRPTAVHPVGPV